MWNRRRLSLARIPSLLLIFISCLAIFIAYHRRNSYNYAENEVYSSHQCLDYRGGGNRKVCRFHNVCLVRTNDSQIQLKYFKHRHDMSMSLYHHDQVIDFGQPVDFLPQFLHLRSKLDHPLNITITNNAIPSRLIKKGVAVFYEPFWPENFGHAIGDDVLPMYRMLKRFNLLDTEPTMVTNYLCNDTVLPEVDVTDWGRRACNQLHESIKMLTKTPPIFRLFEHAQREAQCFETLLAGSRNMGMTTDEEGIFSDMITHYLTRTGLINVKPTRQNILLFEKRGRRVPLDLPAIQQQLQKTFKIPVEIYNPAAHSVEHQIKTVRHATVIISPEGGVSFSALFAAQDTGLILFRHWWPPYNTSVGLEEGIWSRLVHVNEMHYSVHSSEIKFPENLTSLWPPVPANISQDVLYSSYGNIVVNFQRLTKLVLNALYMVEQRYSWKNSYSYVQD